MATAVHIPLEELSPDAQALLERAQSGDDIFVDGKGVGYKISRLPGRTAAEILADPTIQWSDTVPDEDWGKDLEEIIAWRKLPERDLPSGVPRKPTARTCRCRREALRVNRSQLALRWICTY